MRRQDLYLVLWNTSRKLVVIGRWLPPHPGPLPQGEGGSFAVGGALGRHSQSRGSSAIENSVIESS